jgi:hypothetical protein
VRERSDQVEDENGMAAATGSIPTQNNIYSFFPFFNFILFLILCYYYLKSRKKIVII